MNELTRQRIWLVLVSVLAIFNLSLFISNQALRSQLNDMRTANAELRKQIDERARIVVADFLHERRGDLIEAGYWLHALYQSKEGLQRPEGLWLKGRPDFEGIGAWILDVYVGERLAGMTDEAAKQKITDAIRGTDEWRQKHPGGK